MNGTTAIRNANGESSLEAVQMMSHYVRLLIKPIELKMIQARRQALKYARIAFDSRIKVGLKASKPKHTKAGMTKTDGKPILGQPPGA